MPFLLKYFQKYFLKLKCLCFNGLNGANINITLKYWGFSIFYLKINALELILRRFYF